MWLRGNVEEWWQEFQCNLWITFDPAVWRACRSALVRVVVGSVLRCRDSPVGDLDLGKLSGVWGVRVYAVVFVAGVRGDFPYLDGSVPSVERQTTVNGHRRRTRHRP